MTRQERSATARHARLFREAERRLELQIKAITHRNAARGLLQSGATIKEIVRVLDESAVLAVTEALDGIAAITEHAGRQRKRLLEQLRTDLAAHHLAVREIAAKAIERIGLGSDFPHALPLIEEAELRHREKIIDFGEGWTAPAGKPWKERHPFFYDGLLLMIGAALGIAAQSIADPLLQRAGAESHAPEQKSGSAAPTRSSSQNALRQAQDER